MGHKSELCQASGSMKELFQFSMLQRFRQNKDLKSFDKSKPQPMPQYQDDSDGENDMNQLNIKVAAS